MRKLFVGFAALALSVSLALATPIDTATTAVNTSIVSNGNGGITGPILNSVLNSIIAAISYVEGQLANPISSPTTMTMCGSGCNFSDLIAFRNYVYSVTFSGSGSLTLNIADGSYNVSDQFLVTDPKFNHVSIIGDIYAPANVSLNFSGANNLPGFAAAQGGQIGFIDGVTVNGGNICRQSRSIWNINCYNGAISAVGGGTRIHVGGHTIATNFYYGLIADEGGYIVGDPGFTASNSGDVNIFARHGGVIHCLSCHANTASDLTVYLGNSQNLGANFLAEAGGHLYVDGSVGTDSQVIGVGTRLGGTAWAHGMDISGSTGNGAQVDEGGRMELNGSNIHNNNAGVFVTQGGWAQLNSLVVVNNTNDGILVDRGTVEGSGIKSANNGGVGFKVIYGGSLRVYGVVAAGSTGNTLGLSYVDNGNSTPCTTNSATSCDPPALMLLN